MTNEAHPPHLPWLASFFFPLVSSWTCFPLKCMNCSWSSCLPLLSQPSPKTGFSLLTFIHGRLCIVQSLVVFPNGSDTLHAGTPVCLTHRASTFSLFIVIGEVLYNSRFMLHATQPLITLTHTAHDGETIQSCPAFLFPTLHSKARNWFPLSIKTDYARLHLNPKYSVTFKMMTEAYVCVGLHLLSRAIKSPNYTKPLLLLYPLCRGGSGEWERSVVSLGFQRQKMVLHFMNGAQTVGPKAILSLCSPSHHGPCLIWPCSRWLRLSEACLFCKSLSVFLTNIIVTLDHGREVLVISFKHNVLILRVRNIPQVV